jgi:hypothetical protein
MLGFEAVRPNVQAAPDGAWRDGNTEILWEAKSEEDGDGVVSVNTVRQANTHLTWVERELDWESSNDAITVLVTPREKPDEAAIVVATENLYMTGLDSIRQIGEATTELWRTLIGQVHGLSLQETADRVTGELAIRGLDTETLKASLTKVRVAAQG